MVLEEAELRDEMELENIVVKDPNQIEKGLTILKEQRIAEKGSRIDLLCVDEDGVLVVVELKIDEDEGQLRQALRYYNWTLSNIDFIKNAYKEKLKEKSIEIKDAMPRIILVAPEFNGETLLESAYINEKVDVKILKYKCYDVAGKKELAIFEVEKSEMPEIQEKPRNTQDFLNHLKDNDIGEIWKKVYELLKQLADKEPDLVRWGCKFWFGGRKFAEMHVRQRCFYIYSKAEGEWNWDKITSMEDVKNIKENIKTAIELVGGQFKDEIFNNL